MRPAILEKSLARMFLATIFVTLFIPGLIPNLSGIESELSESISKQDLKEYHFPIDPQFRDVWISFYTASSEVDDIDLLVGEGFQIAPSISLAIKDKKLYTRRYAILALGYIKCRDAIPILLHILHDQSEKDYFRNDALYSLFRIDAEIGTHEAKIINSRPKELSFGPITIDAANEILTRPHDISRTWTVRRGP